MITHSVTQGTQEWFEVRAGIPTASSFDLIITPGGDESKSADKYQNLLLYELMRGKPNPEGYKSASMQRGNDFEEDAAQTYAGMTGTVPEIIGFVTDNQRTMGCSPDRFIGPKGILEIKCPEPQTHIGYLLNENLAKSYYPQIQGQLLVTGREWVDIISFDPELTPLVTRVNRDENYLATMRRLISKFHVILEEKKTILMRKGYTFHDFDPQHSSALDAC